MKVRRAAASSVEGSNTPGVPQLLRGETRLQRLRRTGISKEQLAQRVAAISAPSVTLFTLLKPMRGGDGRA